MEIHKITGRRLGKHKPKFSRFALPMRMYTGALPAPPPSISFANKISQWPMMENDVLGDCTIACIGHAIQQWTTYGAGKMFVPTDAQILTAYSGACGYVPGDPSTDQGGNIADVLNYFRTTGIAGNKLDAFMALPTGAEFARHLKLSVQIFGNCNLGIELPLSAQDDVDTWTVDKGGINSANGAPGGWGGHCILVVGYDLNYITFVSWGKLMQMTWDFFAAYCSEAYAMFNDAWIQGNGDTPSGFPAAQAKADLAILELA